MLLWQQIVLGSVLVLLCWFGFPFALVMSPGPFGIVADSEMLGLDLCVLILR